jgi:hypothetical protein
LNLSKGDLSDRIASWVPRAGIFETTAVQCKNPICWPSCRQETAKWGYKWWLWDCAISGSLGNSGSGFRPANVVSATLATFKGVAIQHRFVNYIQLARSANIQLTKILVGEKGKLAV